MRRGLVNLVVLPIAFCGDHPKLLRPALWEPRLQEHFEPLFSFLPKDPLDPSFSKPTSKIPRLRNISADTLRAYVTRGQPFVVEDCGTDAEYLAWTCADFAEHWPEGKMRAEYSAGQAPILLKEGSWFKKARPTTSSRHHMSRGKRLAGPYIWHVKDHEPNEGCSSQTSCWPVKKGVQSHWKTPYFLRGKELNANEARDSFEFWFGIAGGGALSHADAYNEMTLSMQFRGNKTWRLAMHPGVHSALDSINWHDGGIYKSGRWFPEYEFDLTPGECFVFPPGYFHETLVKDDQNREDPCTVAATFQFLTPFPAKYWRNFLPRWMNSHLSWVENGEEFWAPIATISRRGQAPSLNASVVERRVLALLNVLDVNRDSSISLDELKDYFSSPRGTWVSGKKYAWLDFLQPEEARRIEDEVRTELVEAHAIAVLDFHDLDENDRISHDELYTSLWQWNVLLSRKKIYQSFKQKMRKGKGSGVAFRNFEESFIREHGACESSGDAFPRAKEACERLMTIASEPSRSLRDLQRLSIFDVDDDNEDADARQEL